MQAYPIPNVDARDSLAVERMTSGPIAVLGAREGTNQIQLRASIDDPADAAKNPIHFSKSSESIDVHGRKPGGLQDQFLVAHEYPRNNSVSSRWPSCVQNLTQSKRNHAEASSRFFARVRWSKLNTASRYQFAVTPSGCAPVVTTPPPFPVAIGASNSGAS